MYVEVRVNVSEGQVKKIKSAIENDEQVVIRLGYEDLVGEHVLALTKTQANQIEKAKASKKGLDLKLSKSQLKYNKTVTGGFLSAILPFLATAAKTILPPLIGGLAFSGGAKVVDAIDRKVQGGSMNNKLPKVFYVKKNNAGFKLTRLGEGLYLSPWRRHNEVTGNGTYLKPYGGNGYIEGNGLISGTAQGEGPLDKIPILNSLLGWLI